jgi:hypothetical protein
VDKAVVIGPAIYVPKEIGHGIGSDILKELNIDLAKISMEAGHRVARALTEDGMRTSRHGEKKDKPPRFHERNASAGVGW